MDEKYANSEEMFQYYPSQNEDILQSFEEDEFFNNSSSYKASLEDIVYGSGQNSSYDHQNKISNPISDGFGQSRKRKNTLNIFSESSLMEEQTENWYKRAENLESSDDDEEPQKGIRKKQTSRLSSETSSTEIAPVKQTKTKYKCHILARNTNPDQLSLQLSTQKKFYLFVDQVVDLEYFKNIKNVDEYLCTNQSTRIYNGLRRIDRVEHRMDNKCIELNMQTHESKVESIDYFVDYLKSLGNSDIMKTTQLLQEFRIAITNTQAQIRNQIDDPLFQKHYLKRKEAASQVFRNYTAQFDGNKLIQYMRLSVNYEKQLIESNICGFTPALYELIATDSYSFKDQILKYGYYDPINQQQRIDHCMHRAIMYLNSPPLNNLQATQNHYAVIDIMTSDNFKFPVELKIHRMVLDEEYDKKHNLHFDFRDILNVYEFSFKDQSVFDQFSKFRRDQRLGHHPTEDIELNFGSDNFAYQDTQFFNKYYGDQTKDLLQKGNKWFKRCGFINIPKKKFKIEYKPDQQ